MGIQLWRHYVSVLDEGADPKILREYSDLLKQKIKSGIYVLGAKNGDKCFLIVGVTQDLTHKYQASEIIKKLVHDIGGSGGGRPGSRCTP